MVPEICPYCHKLLDEENGMCRLTHEHGQVHLPRQDRPTYAELEEIVREQKEEIERLRQLHFAHVKLSEPVDSALAYGSSYWLCNVCEGSWPEGAKENHHPFCLVKKPV